jgi:hypothetical protein
MFRLRAFLAHATTAGALAADREGMLWGISKVESVRASLDQLRLLRQWRASIELLRVGMWAIKRHALVVNLLDGYEAKIWFAPFDFTPPTVGSISVGSVSRTSAASTLVAPGPTAGITCASATSTGRTQPVPTAGVSRRAVSASSSEVSSRRVPSAPPPSGVERADSLPRKTTFCDGSAHM